MRHYKQKRPGAEFWNKEYRSGEHLALSDDPSEDLKKFLRWLDRQKEVKGLSSRASILDIGTGNGRNLIYVCELSGARGVGYDKSREAIDQARKKAEQKELDLDLSVHSLEEPIPLEDTSQTIVLDMMASHVLAAEERAKLLSEIVRVLRPGGFLFWKTFLLDDDQHAKRLLSLHPSGEAGTYIHPRIKVAEHVSTIEEIEKLLETHFIIHKILPSHGHLRRGAPKRRSVCIYAQKL